VSDVEALSRRIRDFAVARDWGQFHTPKNLVMALVGEVGELTSIFQWLSPEEASQIMDTQKADGVRQELADVLIYLVRLPDVLQVDLIQAALEKIEENETRYPVERCRGSARKYDESP
jgi:NTP pyrophosphatase (non-canonical NTP hydrolase)